MDIHRVSKLLLFAALMLVMMTGAPFAGAVPTPGDVHSTAYLGVMVESVSPEKAASLHLKDHSGAVITGVDQDGPACRAGLKSGDIVIVFDGKPVEGPDQFASFIHSSAAGTIVAMTVIRGGQSKEMKATLGGWKQMAGMPKVPFAAPGSMAFAPPAPPLPPRMYPDIEIPNFTSISARHGIVVEPLSPQLSDFFGVPQNKGVLVRSVENGSPGAVAGLRAGDVIVRVNNETIHDMADWRRALKTRSGKVTMAIVRDKKEQTIEVTLPSNTSKLQGEDWDGFDLDMQAMSEEMQKLGPEFEKNAEEMTTLAQLDQNQIDEINRQANAAVKAALPDMKKQVEQARKQADAAMKAATPEMKKRAEELAKQAAEWQKQSEQVSKEIEKMTPQMERDAIQMADSMKPSAKQLAEMAREISKSMKEMQPELQKQMEQIKRDMEQEKREWQDIFKGTDPNHF
ncbi:MAG TPA: PDZ domain-containing protein [Terriglobales bacterium]